MTRLATEGFESGDVLGVTGYSGTVEAVTPGRISGYYARVGGADFFYFVFTASGEIYFRALMNCTNTTTIPVIRWYSGATQLGSLRIESGIIKLYTGTSTLVHTGTKTISLTSGWFCIEGHVKIADAGGLIEYKIDGVYYAGFSGDTKPGAETTIDQLRYESTVSFYSNWDDLAINNTSGAADNSWCGDAHIYGLIPNADGDSSQFVGSDGNSVSNYLLVDETPYNGDTDYVASATSGHKDLYNIANLPTLPSGSTVKRICVEIRSREITAAADSIQIGLKTNGVEFWSSNNVQTINYLRYFSQWDVNPDTLVDWTESEINALQIGVKLP